MPTENERAVQWFSAKLELMTLVESRGATSAGSSVVIFRATDFDQAFVRALNIGRSMENRYKNEEDEWVRWAFRGISFLNLSQNNDLDGAEVHYESRGAIEESVLDIDIIFSPEQ